MQSEKESVLELFQAGLKYCQYALANLRWKKSGKREKKGDPKAARVFLPSAGDAVGLSRL